MGGNRLRLSLCDHPRKMGRLNAYEKAPDLSEALNLLEPMIRFELTTHTLRMCCSTELSYIGLDREF